MQKNKAISLICSGEIVDLKILYLRNKIFLNIGFVLRNTANNINFSYRANSVKINDQIFH